VEIENADDVRFAEMVDNCAAVHAQYVLDGFARSNGLETLVMARRSRLVSSKLTSLVYCWGESTSPSEVYGVIF
jgi:hypothetical protein